MNKSVKGGAQTVPEKLAILYQQYLITLIAQGSSKTTITMFTT